jgi:hypothetical protein
MYVGKIRQLESISKNRKLDSALDQSIINFQDYWTSGFNPYVGKDIVTSYPNPPEGHRHVHILPVIFPTRNEIKSSNKLKYTDSKACWDSWAKNTDDSEFISSNERLNKIPTSNFCLYYFVDSNRNAYLFHYSISSGHEEMNTTEFTTLVRNIESKLYDNGLYLMDIQEQQDLFADKWLVK